MCTCGAFRAAGAPGTHIARRSGEAAVRLPLRVPSVRLSGEGPAVPAERAAAVSSTGRPDGFSVGGSGPGTVSVVVQVVRGRLHELEVSAGEGVVVSLDALPGPTDVEVT